MKVNRKARRTIALFLNSLAVAILVAFAIVPFASDAATPGKVLAAVSGAHVAFIEWSALQ